MGSGTADGVQTPSQPGVIRREGENWPWIPPKLLKLTPDELQKQIDRLHTAILDDGRSEFADLDNQERLTETMVVYQFAITAVERQSEKPQAQP